MVQRVETSGHLAAGFFDRELYTFRLAARENWADDTTEVWPVLPLGAGHIRHEEEPAS